MFFEIQLIDKSCRKVIDLEPVLDFIHVKGSF